MPAHGHKRTFALMLGVCAKHRQNQPPQLLTKMEFVVIMETRAIGTNLLNELLVRSTKVVE